MAMSESAGSAPQISNPRGLPITTGTEVLSASNEDGYKSFKAGDFHFRRDSYFAHITWPGGRHQMAIDVFLRALMRDVA